MVRKKKLLVLLIGVVVFVLSFPASGRVVFNIDLQPDTYGNAYKGGPAAYDDGVNNWYMHPVFTGSGWVPPYGYNARILPSAGKPQNANLGLRMTTGWDVYTWNWVLPEYFADANHNGLMTDGARVPMLPTPDKYVKFVFYGDAASIGTFDIYLYSNDATEFRWHWEDDVTGWRSLTGYQGTWDPCDPNYTEGENYLIYEGMNLDNDSRAGLDPPFDYAWAILNVRTPIGNETPGSLSAIQLVYEGIPIEVNEPNGMTVDPLWYTWAHDYDSWRGPLSEDGNAPLGWFQQGEWVQYDIFANGDGNEGYYDVYVGLESPFTDANCGVSLDGGPVHVVSAFSDPCTPWDGNTVDMFVHRWYITEDGHDLRFDVVSESAFNIWGINFQWAADQNDYCADVQERLETLDMDYNGDCIVNWRDFADFAGKWLNCNDPEGCP